MIKEFDIDKLYDVATRLKYTRDERRDCKAALAKSPSHSLRDRQTKATIEYVKALEEFDELVKAYALWKDDSDDDE